MQTLTFSRDSVPPHKVLEVYLHILYSVTTFNDVTVQ